MWVEHRLVVQRRLQKIRLGVLSLALGMAACGSPPRPPTPTPSQAAEAAPKKIFYLGRIPFRNATQVVRQSDELLARLAKALGVDEVRMVLAPRYEGVLNLLLEKKIDAAWFGTEAYRGVLEQKLPVEPLVVPNRGGRSWYEGVVITRKDSGISKLSELKGKKFGFVDPQSSSGWSAPKRLLEREGLRIPEDFQTRVQGEPDYLSKHDNVVHAVYFKTVDAGAVYAEAIQDTFGNDPEKIGAIRVLASTGRIPNEPIVVLAALPPQEKSRIREAFLSLELDETEQRVFGGVESFVPGSEALYTESGPSGSKGSPEAP